MPLSFIPLVPLRPNSLHNPFQFSRCNPIHPILQTPTARLVHVSVPISIEAPPPLCHALFSDLSQMPKWSKTLQSVTRDPENPIYSDWSFAWNAIRLSWRARDADPLPDQRDKLAIRWNSVSGLYHIGCVLFEPELGDTTRLTMSVDYDIASLLAILMESSIVSSFVQSAIEADLQRFRNYALRVQRKQRIQSRKPV